LGSSPFARHYSGSRGFFPFLWVLRCFSSPACLLAGYVFTYGYARITTREFPHSEIPGSMTGQRLPRAYRSRPRPSSALGAKASIVCPCSLDQKNTGNRCRYGVFKVHASERPPYRKPPECRHGIARSLKTQQRDVELQARSREAAACHRQSRGRRSSRRTDCRTEIPEGKSIQRGRRLPP
jgi:hypothetical protein